MSDRGGKALHLNRDGRWPGFAWRSLEAGSGGELTLASLPSFSGDRPAMEALAARPAPDGPVGLTVAADGTVFWTDAGRVFSRDPCDGHEGPAPLDPAASLTEPRALAVHPDREALIIADAGAHHLLLLALDTFQLVDVWGGPGSEPGRFDRPVGLAVDGDGAVYVADAGNRRLEKLDRLGAPSPAFEIAVAAAAPDLQRPEAVAWDDDRVWVLDPLAAALFSFRADGSGAERIDLALAAPAGIAVMAGALYVGDNDHRRLLRLDPADGDALGEARGFEGPVAALAARGEDLWLHPGAGAPVRLARRGAAVRQGVLWGGPVELGREPHAWQRLHVVGERGEGRVVFFVHAGPSPGPPPPAGGALGDLLGGFSPSAWRAVGEGDPDVRVGETSEYLWIGALLSGDGVTGPRVEQLRLSFDEAGYAEHLPAIYRVPGKASPDAPESSRETLERFLALFESFFDDAEEAIGTLRRYFDPESVPAPWLDWLASWLALPPEEALPEETKRRLLAEAFEALGWRGTARGLARALSDRLGVHASVEEPHAQTDWWVLPEEAQAADATGGGAPCRSRLGLTTRLAPAAPEGAVMDTTAILDRSHLVEDEDMGEPLFTRTAYQFSVFLPRSQASSPATLERVRELIEREKPAHTEYRICLVDPGIRIGYQALLGIDTLLGAAPASPTRLGEPAAAGVLLGGEAAGRIGSSRVGTSARLGEGDTDVSTGAHRPMREEKPWAQ